MKRLGFTLVELIIVIVVLAIIALVALPKFLSLSRDSRLAVIEQIEISVKSANDQAFYKSNMPSYRTQAVPGRADLLDVDLDNNGTYETRLKWFFLDNTDIEKWITVSESFAIQYEGIENTYIGYDSDEDGQVKDDLCYFHYIQAASATIPPQYNQVTDNC